ncbi:MAG: hypothetical protein OEU92_11840 [Alphaproteobacteria bacterium]|nr:hypothetical protein [Alphaproteobacteria bacterium]
MNPKERRRWYVLDWMELQEPARKNSAERDCLLQRFEWPCGSCRRIVIRRAELVLIRRAEDVIGEMTSLVAFSRINRHLPRQQRRAVPIPRRRIDIIWRRLA